MRVRLVLFGQFAHYLPPGAERGRAEMDVGGDSTVKSLLDSVRLPGSARQYITLNGVRVRDDVPLNDGDEVRVIVPLGGG